MLPEPADEALAGQTHLAAAEWERAWTRSPQALSGCSGIADYSSLTPRRQHFLQMTVLGVRFFVKLKRSLLPTYVCIILFSFSFILWMATTTWTLQNLNKQNLNLNCSQLKLKINRPETCNLMSAVATCVLGIDCSRVLITRSTQLINKSRAIQPVGHATHSITVQSQSTVNAVQSISRSCSTNVSTYAHAGINRSVNLFVGLSANRSICPSVG